ncbi:MAG: hypothetical protein ACR2RF_03610 [Geminicoccaceae bacterium]
MAVHSKMRATGAAMVGVAPVVTLIAWLGPHIGIPPMEDHVLVALSSVLTAVAGWIAGWAKPELVHKTHPIERRISSPETS